MKITLKGSPSENSGFIYKSPKIWELLEDDEIAYIGEGAFEEINNVPMEKEEIIKQCYPCTKKDMIECVKIHFQELNIFKETPTGFAEEIAKDIYGIVEWADFETYLEENISPVSDLIIKYKSKIDIRLSPNVKLNITEGEDENSIEIFDLNKKSVAILCYDTGSLIIRAIPDNVSDEDIQEWVEGQYDINNINWMTL